MTDIQKIADMMDDSDDEFGSPSDWEEVNGLTCDRCRGTYIIRRSSGRGENSYMYGCIKCGDTWVKDEPNAVV